jgi:hypothetical protein
MPTANSKFDRADLRRDRRYPMPTFEVIVECEQYRSIDWSLGGILLDGVCEGCVIGTLVEGWLALPGSRDAFAFSGRIVRTDQDAGSTVVRFDEFEEEVADFFDRARECRLH